MRVVSRLSRHRRFAPPLGLISGVLATWIFAGCGDQRDAICDTQCACKGACNPAEHDACVKQLEASAKSSSDKGCGSAADAFFACEASKGRCVGSAYINDSCGSEALTYYSCLSKANCALLGNVVRCGG